MILYNPSASQRDKVKTKRKGSRKASKAKTNVFDRLALGGSGQWVFVTNTNRGGEIPLLPSYQPTLSIRNRNKLKTHTHKHKQGGSSDALLQSTILHDKTKHINIDKNHTLFSTNKCIFICQLTNHNFPSETHKIQRNVNTNRAV